MAGLSGLYAGDHAQPSERENGECFAEALLDRTDADALREGGVVDETGEVVAELPVLERPLAVAWAGAQLECVDFVAESARAQSARSKGAVDEAAYADCLRAAITADEIEEALVASLTGEWESPAVARLADAQAGCVDGGR